MSTLMFRSRGALAIAAVTVLAAAGCGDGDAGAPDQTPTMPAQEITAACPLVDLELIAANFNVENPTAEEREPLKTGPATAYSCDLSDSGELFLTVGVSIGPLSGTAEANLRAALENNDGEPVSGIGELGGYHELDGIATAAGVKASGNQWLVVFVHGAAGNKAQLVTIAQDVAPKV